MRPLQSSWTMACCSTAPSPSCKPFLRLCSWCFDSEKYGTSCTAGKGSVGRSTPRNSQSGAQPCLTSMTSSLSFGTRCCTYKLCFLNIPHVTCWFTSPSPRNDKPRADAHEKRSTSQSLLYEGIIQHSTHWRTWPERSGAAGASESNWCFASSTLRYQATSSRVVRMTLAFGKASRTCSQKTKVGKPITACAPFNFFWKSSLVAALFMALIQSSWHSNTLDRSMMRS
mmetsp:Transcript_38454/g.87464  ORF Transcript_38454/g.87464 Transcript_38454/m.87464 type:complete len:227 (-) Transcript_38454:170-850(-)